MTDPDEAAADEFDERHGGLERGRQVADDLLPHLAPGPVMDVGAGTGLIGAGLRERGRPVFAVDTSTELATRAGKRLDGRVVLADAQALPAAAGSVPNVVLVHVLHLVGDVAAVLKEVARVLRPGGRAVAIHGVPAAAGTDDILDVTVALEPLKPVVPDTTERLVAAAAKAGLRVVGHHGAEPYVMDITPHEFADSIAQRVWSYLGDVDDRTWSEVVEPVVAALRSLADPDAGRHQVWHVPVAVLAKD